MPERTIKVTGTGRITLIPDLTIISARLTGTEKTYSDAMKKSAQMTDELKDVLAGLGMDPAIVKTEGFGIDTVYKSIDKKGRKEDDSGLPNFLRDRKEEKRVLDGYKFVHAVKIEFDSDNELLGKVLYRLAHSDMKPEFSLSFSVKDKDAAKNTLLEKAVADSKEKAELIAKAAGVTLGEILSIDYSWGELSLRSMPVNGFCDEAAYYDECEEESYDISINPEDIHASDTVTVIWGIS